MLNIIFGKIVKIKMLTRRSIFTRMNPAACNLILFIILVVLKGQLLIQSICGTFFIFRSCSANWKRPKQSVSNLIPSTSTTKYTYVPVPGESLDLRHFAVMSLDWYVLMCPFRRIAPPFVYYRIHVATMADPNPNPIPNQRCTPFRCRAFVMFPATRIQTTLDPTNDKPDAIWTDSLCDRTWNLAASALSSSTILCVPCSRHAFWIVPCIDREALSIPAKRKRFGN